MTMKEGFAVLCDRNGTVTKILNDSLRLGENIQPGTPFARIAAPGSLAKALSFLTEINSQGATFDWEINISTGEAAKTIHFTGSKMDHHILIVGAENSSFAQELFEGMMQMSNEQTNALRTALKNQSRAEKDDSLFDEISRLNNELVSMQRELAKKNAELERLNQEKNRFLGMAAHDLRNPLQSILNLSSYLLEEDPATLGEDYHDFMEGIYSSSEFMAHLVDDLLDVAKIESGKLQLDYSPVDVVGLVSKNVTLNRFFAARKKIQIDLITDSLPTALLDSAKLEQVLNNLLGNAIKFSPAEGHIEVRLVRTGDLFCLSVKDEGPGVSAEESANLFKPFQRGKTGTAGEKSTGLGLVIVKRIVEGHGGKIWLESEVGKGTTFFVSIPLMPPKEDVKR